MVEMITERNLRKLQDNIRNSGWRIQHIAWQPEGKLEYYNPQDRITWLLIVIGFISFFGGPILLSKQGFPVWAGISIMMSGIFLLMTSRFSYGRNLYSKFVAVEATCIDREVQEFMDPDSIGSLIKATFWVPRILCEFNFQGKHYKATPIIVKIVAFNSEQGANSFLDKRINNKGRCTLWVNPDNPLHAVFHQKPKTGPYTA